MSKKIRDRTCDELIDIYVWAVQYKFVKDFDLKLGPVKKPPHKIDTIRREMQYRFQWWEDEERR